MDHICEIVPEDSGKLVPAFCLTCEGDTVEVCCDEFFFDLMTFAKTSVRTLVEEIKREVAPNPKHLVEDYLRKMGYFKTANALRKCFQSYKINAFESQACKK